VLVDEVGVEPGPELRELHAAILRQDPALGRTAADPSAPDGRTPGGGGRWLLTTGRPASRRDAPTG
jgi:hypothetical protein